LIYQTNGRSDLGFHVRSAKSASSSSLIVRRTRLSTVSNRALPVAAAVSRTNHRATSRPRNPYKILQSTVICRLIFSTAPFPTSQQCPVKWLLSLWDTNRFCYLPTTTDSLVSLEQCFPTFFDILPQIAPQPWISTFPITHEQRYFSQKCPFISVAHPVRREQITNYNY